jgi:hypothetical protein
VGLATALAPVAGGAAPLEIASSQAVLADGASADLDIDCPKSKPIVAAGFDADGFDVVLESMLALPHSEGVPGSGRANVLAANPPGAADVGHLTGFAYCKAGSRLREASDGTLLDEGETGRATAKCGRHGRAVSGGFYGSGGGAIAPLFSASRRTANRRGWRVAAVNLPDTGEQQKITVIVLCAKRKSKPTRERTATALVPDLGTATATAGCHNRERALAGGFRLDSGAGGGPIGSMRSPDARSWVGRANDFVAGGPAARLFVYAYCRRG